MAQGGQPAPAGNNDPLQAVLADVSNSLVARGRLTTEWWTTLIGGALSAVLALVHVHGSTGTQIVAIAAPALLAGVYAIVRTMHKSALASTLRDVFPQAAASNGGAATPVSAAQLVAQQAAQGVPVAAVTQTDADFAFAGIEAANG